jgi:hypothetical protein
VQRTAAKDKNTTPCESCAKVVQDDDDLDICDHCADLFCTFCVPVPLEKDCHIFDNHMHKFCSRLCHDMFAARCKKELCRYRHAAHMKPKTWKPEVVKVKEQGDAKKEVVCDGSECAGGGQPKDKLLLEMEKKKCQLIHLLLTGRPLRDMATLEAANSEIEKKRGDSSTDTVAILMDPTA